MKEKIRDWYMEAYPTDDMGQDIDPDITFEMVYAGMKLGSDFYSLIGDAADSIIRERCFKKLAEVTNQDYDVIYRLWLDN